MLRERVLRTRALQSAPAIRDQTKCPVKCSQFETPKLVDLRWLNPGYIPPGWERIVSGVCGFTMSLDRKFPAVQPCKRLRACHRKFLKNHERWKSVGLGLSKIVYFFQRLRGSWGIRFAWARVLVDGGDGMITRRIVSAVVYCKCKGP